MKGLTGLTVAASLLLAAQAATTMKVEASKDNVSANPAQMKARSSIAMSPEQAQVALLSQIRGSKMRYVETN